MFIFGLLYETQRKETLSKYYKHLPVQPVTVHLGY